MNQRLLELAVRRGELSVHIALQRQALAQQVAPVVRAAALADQAVAGVDWLKRHPKAVAAGVAILVLLKPKRLWSWSRQAFMLWRGWQALKSRLPL